MVFFTWGLWLLLRVIQCLTHLTNGALVNITQNV